MDKDIKVEAVNHYGVKLYNRHGKMIASAPLVDGQFVLHPAPESTEYTDINDSCLLALAMTGHASRHNAEKWMIWHQRLVDVSLKALRILPNVISDAPAMTVKCNC